MTANAILNLTGTSDMAQRNPSSRVDNHEVENQWRAVVARDANRDGSFVFAVSSTGIYCRPSCPSRRPRRENVTFFRKADEAEKAGYRACLRCRPKAIGGNKQAEMVKAVCRYIERHLDEPVTLSRLGAEFHQSPFHLAALVQGRARYFTTRLRRLLPHESAQAQSAGRTLRHAGHV